MMHNYDKIIVVNDIERFDRRGFIRKSEKAKIGDRVYYDYSESLKDVSFGSGKIWTKNGPNNKTSIESCRIKKIVN